MGLFKKKEVEEKPWVFAARTAAKAASRPSHGGARARSMLLPARGESAWNAFELRRLRAVRAGVPIVDAAVGRLVRLCGGFCVKTGDGELDRELNAWAQRVGVGHGGVGLDAFLDAYLDSLIVCGRAVGEIVPGDGTIAAVLCADPAMVEPIDGDPLEFGLRGVDARGKRYALQDDGLLLFTPLAPEPSSPYGVSMLRGLEPVAEKLLLIFEAVGACWERFGSPRYAVTLKDEGDALFADEDKLVALADEWRRTMSGDAADLVVSGDVDVRVIGGESEVLDPVAPARMFIEQIVAKLALPPFLLGLSWSTSERMSSQQADLLTSEIDALRRAVTPVLCKIFESELKLRGIGGEVAIEWANVSLQDEVELAKAELYRAEAREIAARLGSVAEDDDAR